jgi:hypothetical protein
MIHKKHDLQAYLGFIKNKSIGLMIVIIVAIGHNVKSQAATNPIQNIQTITFPTLEPVVYGAPDFVIGATVSSGLPLMYSSTDTTVVMLTDNKVHIRKSGWSYIRVTQSGNDTTLAVADSQKLIVNKAMLFVLADKKEKFCGQANPKLTYSCFGFVNGDDASVIKAQPSVFTNATTNSPSGSYPITILTDALADNYTCSNVNGTLIINPLGPSYTKKLICQGDSFKLPKGRIIKESGIFTDTLIATNGCDSLATFSVKVIIPKAFNQNISICKGTSYFADGIEQTQSGTYKDTIKSILGCDSLYRTTILTVQDTPTVKTDLDKEICIGDTVQLNASGNGIISWQNYDRDTILVIPSSTTIYTAVSTSACGSVYQNLTVKVDVPPDKPNIFLSNGVLSTDANSNILWYESKYGLIKNAKDWKYIPTLTGDYYVIAVNGTCNSAPSNTIHFVAISNTIKNVAEIGVRVYPNPIENDLYIESSISLSKVDIYNTLGILIQSQIATGNSKIRIATSEWKQGVYLVKSWPANPKLSPIVKLVSKK